MLLNVHHLSVAACVLPKLNLYSQWAHIDDFFVHKHFVNVSLMFETPEFAFEDQGAGWS
jgi:hypothetical protein